jgi:hypothetical protein
VHTQKVHRHSTADATFRRCYSNPTAGSKKIEAIECRPQRGFTINARSTVLLFAINHL